MDGQLKSTKDRVVVRGGMPYERPLQMPVQNLRRATEPPQLPAAPARTILARALTLSIALAITSYGVYEMLGIVSFSRMTILQGVMILLFAVTLGWIAFAAATAVTGFLIPPPRPRGAAQIAGRRTALVMPIYNEDPTRTAAGLQAMSEALQEADAAQHFEIVVLSDSTNADAWIRESLAIDELRRRLRGVMPVWYRRRWRNEGRKAGNIEEFVKRWGGRYDYMVVLDADSLMSAETLVELVRRMQLDPRLGILQTVPMLIGHESVFARMQQFAGRVYGALIARGMAAWSGAEGNYWGHNAIIRVAAFAAACGLPQLPGRKPFGGHVLSHDFVEAALMRRAGWKVCMAPELGGSWEESPPSLVDVAVRDRRWAQGNLQHSKVIGACGLTFTSRSHFFIGIMSYLSSPLWLALLVVGFALTLQATLIRPEYFSGTFQLFPDWPRFDAERMTELFIFTMIVLFTPKILGVLRTLLFAPQVRRGCGGCLGVTFGALVETILSVLYAPIMMLVQTHHVLEILTGRDSGWKTQRRHAANTAWGEAWNVHWPHMLAGLLIGVVAWLISPTLLAWLSPTLAGLLIAAPLSKVSGSVALGRALGWFGLLRTPEEKRPPAVVRRRDELLREAPYGPADPLRLLAIDRHARYAHISGNLPRPVEHRGHPDAHRLTAEQKVAEANTLEELLAWLGPVERVHVAADARLLERMAELDRATGHR
ncbi:MAG: glucans biosynthesis glucosyltransferase MdoH [Steroidobacteraceae bacterium]|jgi:membrane glycosyltransferase|nr:glucans biosynthesis glucosyltransferase MdoH [Steroidobacteraceae bacterium]